ncbi:MAG TPA: hypothetical protein VNL39_14720 [Xanthobacteraceae bacterium]|nr:hypothetical protein [Xanthobacteraceae bacterium]
MATIWVGSDHTAVRYFPILGEQVVECPLDRKCTIERPAYT